MIGKGMVDLHYVNQYVILAGLVGAIFWDIITWYWGLPTSSSHALIGGFAGAAILAKGGLKVIILAGWTRPLSSSWSRRSWAWFLAWASPWPWHWMLRNKYPRAGRPHFPQTTTLFLQPLTALGHGGNDAQKTMGIVATALFTGGYMSQSDMNGDWGHMHWPITFWQRTQLSPLALTSAGSAPSCTPWVRALRSSSPSAASAPKPLAPLRSSALRWPASLYVQPTPSPV